MPGAPSWLSRFSMHVEAYLHCMAQRRRRLIGPAYGVGRGLGLQQHSGKEHRDDARTRKSPAHFLCRSFAAPSLLAREGTDDVNDGNGVGGIGRRLSREVVERHVTRIYFLFAQDAHQELRRKLVGHGSQAHAYHHAPRRHDERSLPPAAHLFPLPAELATHVRTVENRGLAIAARQSSTLPADGGAHRTHDGADPAPFI